jgi:hypothetical protein
MKESNHLMVISMVSLLNEVMRGRGPIEKVSIQQRRAPFVNQPLFMRITD